MKAREIYEEWLKLGKEHDCGLISDENFEERTEQITNKIDELLKSIDENILVVLKDEDVEGMENYSPTYKGESYFVSDSTGCYYEDELVRFLMYHASDNNIEKIAVAAGAKYIYSFYPETDNFMEWDRDFTVYFFK